MKPHKFAVSLSACAGTRRSLSLLALLLLAIPFAGCELRKQSEDSSGKPVFQAKWKQAELIERVQGKIHFHSIAVDSRGNAIALWERDDFFGHQGVWASTYTRDGSWSPPELIELVVGRANVPALALDGNGNALAVWENKGGYATSIWSNHYTPQNGWGLTVQVELSPANAFEPQVGFLADGRALAVWAQRKGRRIGIWANTYALNKGWGEPSQIDLPPGDAGNAQLAVNGKGGAVAVWEQGESVRGKAIFANQYTPGKGWGRAARISNGVEEAIKPRIAMDGEGGAFAIWEQTVEGEETVWANRFAPGAGWSRPAVIEEAEHEGYAPEIAMDSAGNAIAVWTREVDERELVWAARYLRGQGWQKPQRIQTVDAEYAYLPNVAFNRAGDALAAWYQIDAVHDNVWVSRYSRHKGWAKAEKIENRTSVAFRPAVYAEPEGGFIVLWKMIDGVNPANSIHSLWARRLR